MIVPDVFNTFLCIRGFDARITTVSYPNTYDNFGVQFIVA